MLIPLIATELTVEKLFTDREGNVNRGCPKACSLSLYAIAQLKFTPHTILDYRTLLLVNLPARSHSHKASESSTNFTKMS